MDGRVSNSSDEDQGFWRVRHAIAMEMAEKSMDALPDERDGLGYYHDVRDDM